MAKPNKTRGASLKLIGTAIVFLSFITQNFLYETWRQASEALSAAQSARSMIDKGALINESHFYILSSADLSRAVPDQSALAEYKIRQFALKLHQSEVVNISSLTSIRPEEKRAYIDALHARLGKITDYRSAAEYTSFLNEQAKKYQDAFRDEYTALARKRNWAKWFYLVLYAGGALFLLAGLYYDRRGVAE